MLCSLCGGVGVDTIGSDSVWSAVGRIGEVKGLALLSGLPSKIAMVMVTFSAFLVEKRVAGVLGSFYCLRLSSSQNYAVILFIREGIPRVVIKSE